MAKTIVIEAYMTSLLAFRVKTAPNPNPVGKWGKICNLIIAPILTGELIVPASVSVSYCQVERLSPALKE